MDAEGLRCRMTLAQPYCLEHGRHGVKQLCRPVFAVIEQSDAFAGSDARRGARVDVASTGSLSGLTSTNFWRFSVVIALCSLSYRVGGQAIGQVIAVDPTLGPQRNDSARGIHRPLLPQ